MSRVVLDCSIALAWCFEDETSPETDKLFDHVRDHGALVPTLWHLEIANVLVLAERRGRIKVGESEARLEVVAGWPIETDTETTRRAWRETLALARAERLTTYEAAYLELALRAGLPLLTRDEDRAAAARRRGVTVLPEPPSKPRARRGGGPAPRR